MNMKKYQYKHKYILPYSYYSWSGESLTWNRTL